MHHNIKRLVRCCGGIKHDDDGFELSPMLIGDSVEKFARLLIEECIYEIIDLVHLPQYDAQTLLASREAILDHFGIIP